MTAPIFHILGPLEVRAAGAGLLPVTGRNALLLATLLVNAGRTVESGRLKRALWPGLVPETVAGQLHKSGTSLRKLLERVGRADRLVTEKNVGYRLMVADGELDADEFRRLAVAAEQADAAGQPSVGYTHRKAALALWRGPRALVGLDTPLLAEEVEKLGRRRLRVAEALFARALAERDHELVLELAERLVEPDPAWEQVWAVWIITLYRTQRRAQAAERAVQFDQLDHAGPNPLRGLCYAVGRGDTATVEAYARRLVPDRGREQLQLPDDLPDLTGRRDQREEARWALLRPDRAGAPVVLTGPPGAGKTVLAVHLAHQLAPRFPDGVWFVEVRGGPRQLASQEPVTQEPLARLLRALGLAAEQVAADRADRVASYRQRVAGRRVLLVLDDAPDAASVADLLPESPAAAVLVTSQDQLAELPGAHRIPLAELEPADAAALFRRVAQDSGADLAADSPADLRRVVEVCGRLPLAVRVAGALRGAHRHLSSADLASLIAQGLDTLVVDGLSVPAAIGASYQRLDGLARTMLRRLALLDLPELPVWVAAAVFDATPAVAAEVLARLAGRNLLQAGQGRYRMHELIRRYARQQVDRHEADRAGVLARGYGALLDLAEHAHRRIFDDDFETVRGEAVRWPLPQPDRDRLLDDPLAWFEQERLNLRAAVAHSARLGWAALSWQLALASHEFYTQRGWFDDWFDTHTAALAACQAAGDGRGEAAMLTSLAQPTLVNTGRSGLPTPDDLVRAVALFAAAGDRAGEGFAHRTLGSAHRRAGAFAAAERELALARQAYQECGDRFGQWQAIRLQGQTSLDHGDPAAARDHLIEALALARTLGHARAVPQTTFWLGRAQLDLGDLAGATGCFNETLAAAEQAGDATGVAYCQHGLGDVALRAGRPDEAEELLGAALAAAEQARDGQLAGWVLLSLAEHSRAGKDVAAASRYLAEAAERFAATGATWQRAAALRLLDEIGPDSEPR